MALNDTGLQDNMSDEESHKPKHKKMRVCNPGDVSTDNCITGCTVQSDSNSSMDELEELIELVVNDDYDSDIGDPPESNEIEHTKSNEIDMDFNLSNPSEKAVCDLIDRVIYGNVTLDSSIEWPAMYLMQDQKPVEISKEQFEEFIWDKVALLVMKQCNFKSTINKSLILNAETQSLKIKLEELKKKIHHLMKIVEKIKIKPPIEDKIHKVRNVGTSVNLKSLPNKNNSKL